MILAAEFIKKQVPILKQLEIKHFTFFDKIDTQKNIFTKVNKKTIYKTRSSGKNCLLSFHYKMSI